MDKKEYNAKYYQEHREEIAEKRKKRYQANPEPYKEAVHKWREKNRERWNAYMRERRKLDRNTKV